jgi:serine/threonine-protein kinase RsbW
MDFNKRQTQELQLAINEALANIIQHAYENQPDHAIFIYFVLQPSRIEVIIRDFGKRPPMASHFKHRNLDQLHDRGLGLLFMKRCVDYMTYDFSEEGENQLKFIKYK